MKVAERYVRYLMKVECKNCGEAIFHHEEDARDFVEHSMGSSDEYDEFEPEKARSMLSWRSDGGDEFCSHCDHVWAG
jgi:hypothetical protein